MNTVKENLIVAKALIDTPDKWIKGNYVRGGCMCALGAARFACFGYVHGDDVTDFNPVSAALRREVPEEWCGSIDTFNDAPDTNHADIMALFDRAIEANP